MSAMLFYSHRHAFDVIDTSKEGTVMRAEFNQFLRLATAKKFEKFVEITKELNYPNITSKSSTILSYAKTINESTLLVHFFGRANTSEIYHDLTYEEFAAFIEGFQREILHAEFEEYSRGHDVISEEDFADVFLKYTDYNSEVNSLRGKNVILHMCLKTAIYI